MPRKRQPGDKKRRTREHIIGDLAVNCVERVILHRGFSAERVIHDYGVDLLMYTYDAQGAVENGHVQLQVKGTERPVLVDDGQFVAVDVAYGDVKQWMWEPLPVVLVLYGATLDRAWWLYVQEHLESRADWSSLMDQARGRIRLLIPIANELDTAAIDMFRLFRDRILLQIREGIRHHE